MIMNTNFCTKQPLSTPTSQPSLYPRLGNIDLIKTLNYGVSSKVKLGRDKATQKEYAVKIIKSEYKDKFLSTVEQEAKFLSLVNQEEHPHIVKLVECRPKADYIKKNGTSKKVFALIFEFAEGGDLFECIRAIGDIQEDVARTYFQQLVSTVEYLHNKDIIHGDLKLENLLLAGDFSLKIADFSFASFALDGNNTLMQRQRLGSVNYTAPEILANFECSGQAVDLFSCGVILFLMVVRQSPFDKACLQDSKYKLIMKQQFSLFWKQFEVRNRTFNDSFKDLMNGMLASEPSQRLTLSEIKKHPWYEGKTCSTEELKNEYEAKKQSFLKHQEEKAKEMKKIKEAKAAKKKEIEANLMKPKVNLNSFAMKGIAPLTRGALPGAKEQEIGDRLNAKEFGTERIPREYIFTTFKELSEHFYEISQETMFKLILLLADALFNTYKVYSSEYKIKGRVVSDNSDFSGEVLINITQVDEYSCCINITKVKGPLLPFYKFIEEVLKVNIDKALETLLGEK